MGHKEAHTHAYNHRLLAATQRKIGSFILILTVFVIAWVVFLAAIHNKESSCQHRAHEAKYPNILTSSLTYEEILSAVNTVFEARRVILNFDDEHHKSEVVEVLDTQANLLSNNGFRLLRRHEKSWKWDLRTFSDHMCNSFAPVSMEILPNVDYEKAQYRAIALSVPHIQNNTLQYMLSSQLSTNDGNRISSFVQLESVFPGFYALSSADDKVLVQSTYTLNRLGTGEVYFNGAPLNIIVEVQQWTKGDKPLFWVLGLSSSDVHAQTALMSLQRSLGAHLMENNMMCKDKVCMSPDDVFLL